MRRVEYYGKFHNNLALSIFIQIVPWNWDNWMFFLCRATYMNTWPVNDLNFEWSWLKSCDFWLAGQFYELIDLEMRTERKGVTWGVSEDRKLVKTASRISFNVVTPLPGNNVGFMTSQHFLRGVLAQFRSGFGAGNWYTWGGVWGLWIQFSGKQFDNPKCLSCTFKIFSRNRLFQMCLGITN